MTRAITEADTTGGSSLLPFGVRQYNISRASIEFNKYNGGRELVLTVFCPEGSGSFTVPLEQTGGMSEDTLCWLVGMNIGGLGVPVVGKSVEQVVQSLPAYLHTIVNGIVELDVTHKQSTKLKDDGTPFINHQVKVLRMVAPGTGTPPVISSPAQAGDQFFSGSVEDPDDDIPFPAAQSRPADGVPF